MRLTHILFLCVFSLGGCGTAQTITTRTPLYKYRPDIQITVGSKSIPGMITVERTEPTKIQIDSPVKMDLVRISSCSRDFTTEKVGQRDWWFSQSGKQMVFEFSPSVKEREGFCPVYIQIFDDKLLTAWGFVGFKTTEKLKAKVSCNGLDYPADGVDLCYSMQGFEQGLYFDTPIKYTTRGPCNVKRVDEKTLSVSTQGLGFCRLTAMDEKQNFFKFVLLGYDEILVRGRATPVKTDYGGGW